MQLIHKSQRYLVPYWSQCLRIMATITTSYQINTQEPYIISLTHTVPSLPTTNECSNSLLNNDSSWRTDLRKQIKTPLNINNSMALQRKTTIESISIMKQLLINSMIFRILFEWWCLMLWILLSEERQSKSYIR